MSRPYRNPANLSTRATTLDGYELRCLIEARPGRLRAPVECRMSFRSAPRRVATPVQ